MRLSLTLHSRQNIGRHGGQNSWLVKFALHRKSAVHCCMCTCTWGIAHLCMSCMRSSTSSEISTSPRRNSLFTLYNPTDPQFCYRCVCVILMIPWDKKNQVVYAVLQFLSVPILVSRASPARLPLYSLYVSTRTADRRQFSWRCGWISSHNPTNRLRLRSLSPRSS